MTSGDPLNIYAKDSRLRPVDVRKDLDEIANLIETCFFPTMDEDGKAYLRQLRKSAEDARRLGWAVNLVEENQIPVTGFVWVENDHVVGNLTLIPMQKQGERVYLVANVAVLPEYRRKSIANRLTRAAINYVKEKKGVSIWLQVRENNPPAELLYLDIGFIERTRRTAWHNFTGDPKPGTTPGFEITSTWPADWNMQVKMLENNYPSSIVWNLPVNIQKFKPTLFSQFTRVFIGETSRTWALRRNGTLQGTLTWEAARTWADNLWVGCKPENQETVLSHLLPHAMSALHRTQPQSINFPAGVAGEVFERYGFKKHITLIWMELEIPKKDISHTLASV